MALGRIRRHSIDILFPLAVLLVFGASSVMAILLAANIYGGSVKSSGQMYNGATALAYVQEKLHQNDSEGAVRLERYDEIPVLVMEQSYQDQRYCTYIYAWEGSLRELFANQDLEFDPSAGRKLLNMEAFSCRWLGEGLLEIRCTDEEGTVSTACVGLLSAEV